MNFFKLNRGAPAPSYSSDRLGSFERILVVGEPGNIDQLMEPLETNLYDVDSAETGPEAIRKLIARDYDVIVCHLGAKEIPVEMFYLALQRVRAHLCKKLVFITNHGVAPGLNNFAREHSGILLWDPIQNQDLFDAVNLIARKQRKTARR